MRFLDIFAGIGGMRRGLENAGHRCVGYIEWDKHARKSYEAIFDTAGEWTAHDVTTVDSRSIPRADIWTFGFPCQDLSVAGRQAGFSGQRSSLFFTVIDLIRNTEERDRPEWLIAENVMGLFSSNRGYDFLAAQIALDEVGYDVEWEVFNATQFGIQQNRQRVFIVGHSRRHGRREVFPLGDDATEAIDAFGDETVYHYHSKDGTMREFSGVTPTLTGYMGTGGNNVPLVEGQQKQLMWTDGGLGHAIQVKCDITPPIRAQGGGSTPGIFVSAVLTPDREEKRQNGRRFKDVGEPMFTLTAQDKRGVMVIQKTHGATTTVNYDKTGTLQAARLDKIPCIPVVKNHGEWPERETAQSRIRKLTPLECWRLMGRTDADFHAARIAGVSDTQLYKQAGNSLVPQIAEAIGRAIL